MAGGIHSVCSLFHASYARLAIGYSQSHLLSGIRSLSPFPFLLLRAACLCVISVYKLLLLFVGARTHLEQANWVWVASSLFLTLLTLSVCMYVCIQEHVCVCVCTKFSFVCHSYAPVYPPVQPYLRWRLYNIAIFSLPLHLLTFRRNIETHNHNIILQLLINGKLESGLVFLPYKLVDFTTPLFSLRHCVVVPFASCLQLYITIN